MAFSLHLAKFLEYLLTEYLKSFYFWLGNQMQLQDILSLVKQFVIDLSKQKHPICISCYKTCIETKVNLRGLEKPAINCISWKRIYKECRASGIDTELLQDC